MVLVSAVAAQSVFAGMSVFQCALGSFIIENVAFLRAMSTSISGQLQVEGRLEQAFMTILFCFSLSTLLTGCAFYALGKLRLGRSTCLLCGFVCSGCPFGALTRRGTPCLTLH